MADKKFGGRRQMPLLGQGRPHQRGRLFVVTEEAKGASAGGLGLGGAAGRAVLRWASERGAH